MFAQELFLSYSEMRWRVGGGAPSYGDHFQFLLKLRLDRSTEACFANCGKFQPLHFKKTRSRTSPGPKVVDLPAKRTFNQNVVVDWQLTWKLIKG